MIESIVLVDATPAHFEAIIAMERAQSARSIVALTHGHALTEALERGHIVVVALAGDAVVGWIWCSIDDTRGGESVGQLHGVSTDRGQPGAAAAGRALIEHARAILTDGGCARMRTTLAGDDAGTAALLAGLGFAVEAVIMQRPL
jgi:RimJ/RimL family protein N-acetyltransferase